MSFEEDRTRGTRRVVRVGDVAFGADPCVLIAGPCAVEDEQMLLTAAAFVAEHGARVLRGGAFKPRTSPYSFQGLGRAGLTLLDDARTQTGLPVVTELLDVRDAEHVGSSADLVQIGARNMHNVPLLREAAAIGKPILLKRGPGATIDELLSAADYVLEAGNGDVILCERGIRSFEQSTRYTLDLAAVPVLHARTDLPVVVDPSHAAGDARLVPALARAAVAAGADGVMVEVHPDPQHALSDGRQSLSLEAFAQLARDVAALARVSFDDDEDVRTASSVVAS